MPLSTGCEPSVSLSLPYHTIHFFFHHNSAHLPGTGAGPCVLLDAPGKPLWGCLRVSLSCSGCHGAEQDHASSSEPNPFHYLSHFCSSSSLIFLKFRFSLDGCWHVFWGKLGFLIKRTYLWPLYYPLFSPYCTHVVYVSNNFSWKQNYNKCKQTRNSC